MLIFAEVKRQRNEEIKGRGRNPRDVMVPFFLSFYCLLFEKSLLDATKFQVINFGLVWTAEKKHIQGVPYY